MCLVNVKRLSLSQWFTFLWHFVNQQRQSLPVAWAYLGNVTAGASTSLPSHVKLKGELNWRYRLAGKCVSTSICRLPVVAPLIFLLKKNFFSLLRIGAPKGAVMMVHSLRRKTEKDCHDPYRHFCNTCKPCSTSQTQSARHEMAALTATCFRDF